MSDREKLTLLARAVDEMRRLHRVTRRPPNQHERREIERAEAEVDRLVTLYLPADVDTPLHPAQPV